jgi:hypothetical protein
MGVLHRGKYLRRPGPHPRGKRELATGWVQVSNDMRMANRIFIFT